MQKNGLLLRFVDVVWKTTLLSSRRASNRSRHVESLAGLDLGHADRSPLSLVCPVVVKWRRSGGGSSEGAAEMVVSVCVERATTEKMSVRVGRW